MKVPLLEAAAVNTTEEEMIVSFETSHEPQALTQKFSRRVGKFGKDATKARSFKANSDKGTTVSFRK